MTRPLPKYVNAVLKKNGTVFYYFRRVGFPRTPLPGPYMSTAFQAAYAAALDQGSTQKNVTTLKVGSDRTVPGTINALIADFYQSEAFTKNKPITRATDRNILERFRARHGDKRVSTMELRHVQAALNEKSKTPAAKRNLLRVLRVLSTFAVEQGLRKDNPAATIKLKPYKTTGHHSWTEAEVCQYEARHPIGSKARLALALLLYTAQRRSDVVKLGPANIEAGRFVFTQSKTGTPMSIPIAPPLAEIIAATPMVGMKAFLVTSFGKPFTAPGFGNWFREQCDMAGLHHCTAHGLRKAFMVRMAEAGCSEDYIASISGHKDMREIRVYVAAASRKKMADDGMNKTLLIFPGNKK